MSVHLSLSPRLFYTEISFPVNKAYPDLIKSLMDCDNQRKNLAISYKIFSAALVLTGHRNIHLIYMLSQRGYIFKLAKCFGFFFSTTIVSPYDYQSAGRKLSLCFAVKIYMLTLVYTHTHLYWCIGIPELISYF